MDPRIRRRLQGRRKYLFELWQKLLQQDTLPQFDRWLAREMKQRRQFGKQDRYWYSEMLFATLRFGYLAIFLEETFVRMETAPQAVENAFLTRQMEDFRRDIPDFPALRLRWKSLPPERFFDWIARRYAEAPAVFPLETGLTLSGEAGDIRSQYLARCREWFTIGEDPRRRMLWNGVPLWFEEQLQRRIHRSGWSADRVGHFLDRQSYRPPLWLRFNYPQQRDEVLAELHAAGFQVQEEGPALRVQGQKGIFELTAYRRGWVEIQDRASQRLGELVAARPGQMVWDCCAGGGGKTLQIATHPQGLRHRGAVYASDIREYKLRELRRRARRAQLANVRTLPWDGQTLPPFPGEVEKRGGFHWVLVDAPCSASGTWRRNPDAKFRFAPGELPEMVALQKKLLSNASRGVRTGGHLVYATCSWFVEENEDVVEDFLQKHPQFRLQEMGLFGNPEEDADTTFGAVMQRIAEE